MRKVFNFSQMLTVRQEGADPPVGPHPSPPPPYGQPDRKIFVFLTTSEGGEGGTAISENHCNFPEQQS